MASYYFWHLTSLNGSCLQAAWGGIPPVYMVFGKHTSSQNPFWYRSITSEPCLWLGRNMLRKDEELAERFRTNPFWMQAVQCHNDLR